MTTVTGSHFEPGDTVHIILQCGSPDCTGGIRVATTTAALDGTVAATFTVPSSLPAGHEFASAQGTDPLTYFAVNSTKVF